MEILAQGGLGSDALKISEQLLQTEMTKLLVILTIIIVLMVIFIFWVIDRQSNRQSGGSNKSIEIMGDMVEVNRDQSKYLQSINTTLQLFTGKIVDGFVMVSDKIDKKSDSLNERLDKDFKAMSAQDTEVTKRLDDVIEQLNKVMAIVLGLKESNSETLMNKPVEIKNDIRIVHSADGGASPDTGSSVRINDSDTPGSQIPDTGPDSKSTPTISS